MPNVAVVGNMASDSDGSGAVISSTISKMRVGGILVVGVGSSVQAHGGHTPNKVMVTGSSKMTVQGIPVCLSGHTASCGAVLTGTSKMTVGS